MAINSVTPSAAPSPKSLGLQDFMKILLTQLQYQDPLKPMDNQQFMAQMAQFTSLEQAQQMNDKLSTLIANQASLQSVGLIGRTVDFASASGTTVTGQVTAISLAGDSPQVTVTTSAGAALVALGQLIAVR